jgi:hypothetical protein
MEPANTVLSATNLLMKPFTTDTPAARIKELIAGRDAVDGRTA